jgi:lauroyl/myristoyl acyltransferase
MRFMALKDLYFLVVIALINLVDWLSLPKLKEFVISSIAVTAYRLSSNKRRSMLRNVTLAFNGMVSERDKQEIVKGAFRAFWKSMFSWSESTKDREEYMKAELCGSEHLHHALRNANGVILWESNGFGNRILSKRILYGKGFLIHQVHGANNLGGFLVGNSSATWVRRTLINRFFENCERRFVTEIIKLPRSNSLAFTRALLNRLNQNAILCIAGDGKTGQKMIPRKFLGRSDFFSTGIVSLAKISGAVILPMFCVRETNGKINLVVEKPITVQKGENREESLESGIADYVNLLEAYIRRHPEQYINWHLSWDLLGY